MNLIKKFDNPRVLTRYEVNKLMNELRDSKSDSVECVNTLVRKDGEFIEMITIAKSELWRNYGSE